MGELALAGRDEITFFASPSIEAFGVWVEQPIAESTGKNGTGILPVAEEKLEAPSHYSDDRFFVYLRMEGDENDALDKGIDVLESLRLALQDRLKVATTVGYGPRFLHSTGQLHKCDGNKGLFIQITHTPESDIPIPGEPYSFGTLVNAQALGDYQALAERGRRLIRFHIKGDVTTGLKQLQDTLW